MATINFSYFSLIYVVLFLAFLIIRTPVKINTVQLHMTHKILFTIEFLLILFILLLSITLLSVPSIVFMLFVFLSIVSMISLLIVMIQMMMNNKHIQIKFIYATHSGIFIVFLSFLSLLFSPEANNSYSQEPPFSLFLMGIFIFIPYFHVMILQRFFIKSE